MITVNVDCCEIKSQENEPRVTFTTHKFVEKGEEPFTCIIREHIPLSAAMQIIVTDRQVPDGFVEHYHIVPEHD